MHCLKLISENEFLLAAYQGDLEHVKHLIVGGQNVSQQNDRNQNALHFAATNGNLELVKLLVDAGLQPAQRVNVVYFDQRMVAVHSKCWSTFFVQKSKKK